MKKFHLNWKKCLALLSVLLCLSIVLGNVAGGTWTGLPFGQTVEARKNKKSKNKNKNNESTAQNAAENGTSQSTGKSSSDQAGESTAKQGDSDKTEELLDPDGSYTTKEDVALYIYQYGKLPQNFITKKEAQSLGWSGGSLEPYAPGKCIGGSRFGNYEGNLPEAPGRTYTECDIDTLGAKSRGAKRIVFSNDGLIYYTEDHYETFELLYGEE